MVKLDTQLADSVRNYNPSIIDKNGYINRDIMVMDRTGAEQAGGIASFVAGLSNAGVNVPGLLAKLNKKEEPTKDEE